MHVEDLAVAQQLAADRGADLLVVVAADVGQDRVPVLGRGEDRGHLADAGERHLQRARDRRRGHGEHVDVRAQRLDVLLVLDAEPLLLVDDHQAEVLVAQAGLQQPVRADDDVDLAGGQALDDRLGVQAVGEPGQALHGHREGVHALGERVEVLLGEQRGRHQHGDLLAVLHGLERGAHGDLGLAVADVAADDPVHRDAAHHVGLDLVDGRHLVGRLGERERVLELALPRGVRAERVAGRGLAGGVELDELGGDLLDRLLGPGLGVLPVGAAELVERGQLAADVAGDLVELVGGDEQPVAGLAALGATRTPARGTRGWRRRPCAGPSRCSGRCRAARAPRSRRCAARAGRPRCAAGTASSSTCRGWTCRAGRRSGRSR